jgi:hypothetical protein
MYILPSLVCIHTYMVRPGPARHAQGTTPALPISADPCEVSALQKGHELLETCSTVACGSGSGTMAVPGSGVVWRLSHCTAPSGLIGSNLGLMIRHRPYFVLSVGLTI